jgi:hypothetical protein
MKRYVSTFAVSLILYAAPAYSQTAQFEHPIPNVAPVAPPGVTKTIDAPPLNSCMIEIQTANLKGVKPAEEWSSGYERRVDTYCRTHDTGDDDDTPSNTERDHLLSACNNIPIPASCKRAFREMCPALATWQAANP